MSHSTPPDDPTELLKAFFRHIEAHLEENNSLSDPEAKRALKKGLATLTGMTDDQPEISVLDGGLSGVPIEFEENKNQAPPVLSIHNKIESDAPETEVENTPIAFGDFQIDSGAHVSVHIVNADEVESIFSADGLEHGQILLSETLPNQTVFFGTDVRHVRIYCSDGQFEVGVEDGPVGTLHAGQSIDVEAPCVFVTTNTAAEGHYVMVDAHGLEW